NENIKDEIYWNSFVCMLAFPTNNTGPSGNWNHNARRRFGFGNDIARFRYSAYCAYQQNFRKPRCQSKWSQLGGRNDNLQYKLDQTWIQRCFPWNLCMGRRSVESSIY